MALFLVCTLLLAQAAKDNPPPESIQKYLVRCEQAKAAAIEVKTRAVRALEAVPQATRQIEAQIKVARDELLNLRESPASPLPIRLPTEKDSVGVFTPVDPRLGRSVDVLEIIDDDDVIVRAWFWVTMPLPQNPTAAEDATFVDLWVHGVDTSQMASRTPVQFKQVFHVTGNKLFDTTCGKRSLPLLEPIDLAPYR